MKEWGMATNSTVLLEVSGVAVRQKVNGRINADEFYEALERIWMDAVRCRTCGERHRVGECPKSYHARAAGRVRRSSGTAVVTTGSRTIVSDVVGRRELKGRTLNKDRAKTNEATKPRL